MMLLLVSKDDRLSHIVMNLEKLYDIFEVGPCNDYDQTLFSRLDEFSDDV